MMAGKFNHADFTALCVLLNSNVGMTVEEHDKYTYMLMNAANQLRWLAEQKGCMSCKFFCRGTTKITGCEKAGGKLPPDNIQKSGCEMHENKFEIPF